MRRISALLLFTFFITFLSMPSMADSSSNYLGVWQTIDDKTKNPRSLIRVSIQNQMLLAHIIKVFPNDDKDGSKEPICDKCTGELKNRKVVGLNILSGMRFNGKEWTQGQILDPGDGKKYDAKIWLDNNVLFVRGYIGFFYRTQEWIRIEGSISKD